MKKNIFCLFLSLFSIFSSRIVAQSRLQADLIIFSYDRPLQLYALLESLYLYTTDINSIAVVYRTSGDAYNAAFNEVSSQFPDVTFLHQQSIHDFKSLTLQALQDSSSDYQ